MIGVPETSNWSPTSTIERVTYVRRVAYGRNDFDAPDGWFIDQVLFVVLVPAPIEGVITEAQVLEVTAEARGDGDAEVTTLPVDYGWGAADAAIGLVIDLAVGFAPSVVAEVWRRLRHRRPVMSAGALRYLCMADLAQRLGLSSLDDFVEVVVSDTAAPRPLRLHPLSMAPVLVVFADRANTRSWVYLVSPRGQILSFHEGEPMTGGLTGLPEPAKEPPLLLPDESPEVE